MRTIKEEDLASLRRLKATGDFATFIQTADARLATLATSDAHFQNYDLWFLARHDALVRSNQNENWVRAIEEGLQYSGWKQFNFEDRIEFLRGLSSAANRLNQREDAQAFNDQIVEITGLLGGDLFPGPELELAEALCARGNEADAKFSEGNSTGALEIYSEILGRLQNEKRHDIYLMGRASIRSAYALLRSMRFEEAVDYLSPETLADFEGTRKIGHWILNDGGLVLDDWALHNLLFLEVSAASKQTDAQARLLSMNELALLVIKNLPSGFEPLRTFAFTSWERALSVLRTTSSLDEEFLWRGFLEAGGVMGTSGLGGSLPTLLPWQPDSVFIGKSLTSRMTP
jgi:hypothetical protein